MKQLLSVLCGLVLLAAASHTVLLAQQTTFTYEGYFTDANTPAQGPYDFRFTLHDLPANGLTVAGPVLAEDVPVQQGRFQLPLDFGDAVFNGEPRWLEIAIRPGADNGEFTILEPRQLLTPTPYAIRAYRAAGVDDGAIDGAAIAPGSLDASHLFVPTGPQPGQVLSYDGGNLLWTDPGPAGDSVFSLNGSSAYYLNGNVGLGTIAPGGKLHLYDPALSVTHVIETGGDINAWTKLAFVNAHGQWVAGTSRGFIGDGFYIHREGSPGITFAIQPTGDIHYQGRLTRLDVGEEFAAHVRAADFLLGHPSRRGAPGRALVDFGSSLVVNFGNDWGTTIIGGAVTEVRTLRITGGADLAEPFALSHEEVAPGTVVVIDEAHPGQLKLSTEAYDTRVAGIVSGANGVNPGMTLHQQGLVEGSQNVALTGRVYVQADASFGSIRPGDLLTTSDTPGHAMKVTDHSRAQGAILGKAMSPLSDGRGMVLVLVTLQ